MSSRERIVRAVSDAVIGLEPVRAAWLGGSDATGRADERSDVDLVVVAAPEAADAVLEAVEEALAPLGGVDQRFRVPQPTWHGHEQAFFHVAGLGPEGLVDVVVAAPDALDELLVAERHGTPAVIHDPEGLLRAAPLDREAHERRLRERLERLRATFPMFSPLALKEAERGRDLDALTFWHSQVVAPLVTVLRCLHAPERFDFGGRYLEEDLPADVVERLRPLLFVKSGADIRARHAEAGAWFEETVRALDQR